MGRESGGLWPTVLRTGGSIRSGRRCTAVAAPALAAHAACARHRTRQRLWLRMPRCSDRGSAGGSPAGRGTHQRRRPGNRRGGTVIPGGITSARRGRRLHGGVGISRDGIRTVTLRGSTTRGAGGGGGFGVAWEAGVPSGGGGTSAGSLGAPTIDPFPAGSCTRRAVSREGIDPESARGFGRCGRRPAPRAHQLQRFLLLDRAPIRSWALPAGYEPLSAASVDSKRGAHDPQRPITSTDERVPGDRRPWTELEFEAS